MRASLRGLLAVTLLLSSSGIARADKYDDAHAAFRRAEQSGAFFSKCYGYALFPTIGKGGIGIGGAHGSGRVYAHGAYTGTTSMTQVTIGFQLGGQAYSEIIFFEDKRAFDEFTSGTFEFGAQAQAVAIKAGASAQTSTGGSTAGTSSSQHDAKTAGGYYKGMAIFTVTKGGAMAEMSIAGQKFSYKTKK